MSIRNLSGAGSKKLTPVFIGGTGRSGTTILKEILVCHSKVVSLPDELRMIVDPGGALDLILALSERWSPYNADIAIQCFQRVVRRCGRASSPLAIRAEKLEKRLFRAIGLAPRKYLGLGLSNYFGRAYYRNRLNRLIEDLGSNSTAGNWAGSPGFPGKSRIFDCGPLERWETERLLESYFNDLYKRLARGDETHWVEDTPANILHAQELLSLFPNMKLIHIYRDPRDVLASYRTFSWGGKDIQIMAKRLAGIYCEWFKIRRSLPAESYLEISLEKLSQYQESTTSEICDFLDLPFEQELTGIQLDKAHAGRWKRDLTKDELASATPYLAAYISAYQYEI